MRKPVLYIQAHPSNKRYPLFDFCEVAKRGAEQCGIKVKLFQDSETIPGYPTNIVVGSVEMCAKWLTLNGYKVPQCIDLDLLPEFLGREITITHIKDVKFPTFIKPYSQIKAFTGFSASSQLYIDLFAEDYDGLVWSQEIVDIVSEYRLYITENGISDSMLGLKHYSGDSLVFPDADFIRACVGKSKEVLNYRSYTLDFGVLEDGRTILIEPNDGWACGNYGLEPNDYYKFVKNRWLQITGVLK